MAFGRDRSVEQERIAAVVGVLGVIGACSELELLTAVNRVIVEFRADGLAEDWPEGVWEVWEPGDLGNLLHRLARDGVVERFAEGRWRRPAHLLAGDDQRFEAIRDVVLAWWKTDPRSRAAVSGPQQTPRPGAPGQSDGSAQSEETSSLG
jgi:hypothetical protein